MTPTKIDFTIYQGTTFRFPFFWYSDVKTVLPISAVALTYPAVLTSAAHGLPASAVPMTFLDVGDWINSATIKPKDRIYATKVDTDNFSVDLDGTGQDAYTGSAGRAVFNQPMDLSVGWHARCQIRASIDDDTVLAEFLSDDSTILLGTDGSATLVMTDADTDLLDFSSAVYDLELIEDATGDVFRPAFGTATLSKQTTRT